MVPHTPPAHDDPIGRTQAALRQALANLEQKPSWKKRFGHVVQVWALPVALIAAAVTGYVYRAPVVDWAQNQVAKATGAQVSKIVVEGAQYSTPEKLKAALGLEKGDSLVTYNTAAARARLEELPWVRLAAVEKRLPSTVQVTVYEHVPLARLEDEDGVWVVNKDGDKIEEDSANRFGSLPLLHGEGAPPAAAGLFAVLAGWPNLAGQLEEATYVGNRRWDLHFKSGVVVMLPEGNPQAGLALLEKLENARHVLALEGGTVDLRIPERITLNLPIEVGPNPTTNPGS